MSYYEDHDFIIIKWRENYLQMILLVLIYPICLFIYIHYVMATCLYSIRYSLIHFMATCLYSLCSNVMTWLHACFMFYDHSTIFLFLFIVQFDFYQLVVLNHWFSNMIHKFVPKYALLLFLIFLILLGFSHCLLQIVVYVLLVVVS
jgi:hypothetical protein